MVCTFAGISMLCNAGNNSNVEFLILVCSEFGSNVTDCNARQPSNVVGLIVATFAGMRILFNRQLENM